MPGTLQHLLLLLMQCRAFEVTDDSPAAVAQSQCNFGTSSAATTTADVLAGYSHRASLLHADADEPNAVSLLQRRPTQSVVASDRHAWASLIYGHNVEESLIGLRAAMASARRHGSIADRVVITPSGPDGLSTAYRQLLASDGLRIIEVPPVALPTVMQQNSRERWYGVLNKYNVFNLTQYDKVVLLDTDVLFSGVRNPDTLFQLCDDADICMTTPPKQGSAAAKVCGFMGNAGVMVVKPSQRIFDMLLEAIAQETRPWGLPDQSILACFIHDNPDTVRFASLPGTWNSCYDSWPDSNSAAIVHWCGQDPDNHLSKPWQCNLDEYCGDARGPQVQKLWVSELEALDSCVLARDAGTCEANHACHWCHHYCMDTRIACSKDLFVLRPTLLQPLETKLFKLRHALGLT